MEDGAATETAESHEMCFSLAHNFQGVIRMASTGLRIFNPWPSHFCTSQPFTASERVLVIAIIALEDL